MLRALILTLLLACAEIAVAEPRVEMTVLAEPGLATNSAAQRWTKLLSEVGIKNVRFRGSTPGDKIDVEGEGTGDNARFRVVAQLNSRGALVTPGGQFSLADRDKLVAWIDKLANAGTAALGHDQSIFGLSPPQFEQLRTALSPQVGFSTKDVAATKVVEQIKNQLKLPLVIEPSVQQALAADEPVRDELQNLSYGTALAAIARPAGAVVTPRLVKGTVELVMTPSKPGVESWPIGWRPDGQKDRDMLPMLFEFVNVEIDDISASEALSAIEGRLKSPFLFDHNNLVRHRIDMKKGVSFPQGRTYYRRILDRLLFQVGLKGEIRVDEAGRPLVWISTIKQ